MTLPLNSGHDRLLPILQELSQPANFQSVVKKATKAIEELIECEGAIVFETRTSRRQLIGVSGNERLSNHFREKLTVMNDGSVVHPLTRANDLSGSFAHEFVLSDIISLTAFREHPYYKKILSKYHLDECMTGQILSGAHRSLWLSCYRRGKPMRPREREVFRQVLSTLRGVCSTRASNNFERFLAEKMGQVMEKNPPFPALVLIHDWSKPPHYDSRSTQILFDGGDPLFSEERISGTLRSAFQITEESGWETPLRPRWVDTAMTIGTRTMQVSCLARLNGTGAMLIYPPKSVRADPSGATEGWSKLTRRQNTVLHWVCEGKANDEIAAILSISTRTVEKHLQTAFQTLGVENRLAAANEFKRQSGS